MKMWIIAVMLLVSVGTASGQHMATDVATRIRVHAYTTDEAVQIAEVALEEGDFWNLPDLLCADLPGPAGGGFSLCLTLGRTRLRIELPGMPHYAVRDDGELILLISRSQCNVLDDNLWPENFRSFIPVVLAGFKAAPPGTAHGTPLTPDCGECMSGKTCTVNGQTDCCEVGSGDCTTCKSCLTLGHSLARSAIGTAAQGAATGL